MSKPFVHARSSAKLWGGDPEDYMEIHKFMDSSKGAIADNRHRALTHNAWFIMNVLPKVFGDTFINSAGREVSTRDVGEQHVAEDYGMRFIPTAQDFLEAIPYESWMHNGKHGLPPSQAKVKTIHHNKIEDND